MSNYRSICIFGKEENLRTPHLMGSGSMNVKYFSHKQIEFDPSRMCGIRAHVYINLDEPSKELRFQQEVGAHQFHAPIIDLYNNP